ncbi:hypothetical protein Q4Q39_04375 [Flavivirga amylovorans]|uniref:Lipoprotein n=1 Tax=Flavivirga amylovorans TaxID=870486 RepID=A0ABT8WY69_9FLAO|nr:hypothetical protein [Flavivirga amylovorans]MDO5986636.1 hypothetical protein [Flavivirga amylovorans]
MKYYIYLPVLIILIISCNNDKKGHEINTNNNKTSEQIQKENDLPKKESQVEKSIESNTSSINKDSEAILIIRKRFNDINASISSFTKKESKDISVSKDMNPENYAFESESIYRMAMANLDRFYQGDDLKKSIVSFQGDKADLVSEYYYWNNKLFFVFKTKTVYQNPKWSEDFKESDKEKIENRFYFENDKLIRWIDQDKNQIDLNKEEAKNTEKETLSDSQLYRDLK